MAAPEDLSLAPFLMFTGQAEEAMAFYVGLFDNSEIVELTRYAHDEEGPAGTVKVAAMSVHGQRIMCIDSPVKHEFTFTPAISLFVVNPDGEKITRYFEALSEGGQVLMPLDKYPFSEKYGWVQDRYGVSWQLSVS